MSIQEIIIRLLLITAFSGVIGYERERNNSHAGLKTHMLVGISATLIALIQQSIVQEVIHYELTQPEIAGAIRSDPARLIAQVVSGIGFLGGGTIIVTKRNVSGLTTAASIWSVAGLGLSLGMGYYDVGIAGFVCLVTVLIVTKQLQKMNFVQRLSIEYIGGNKTVAEIESTLSNLGLEPIHLSYQTKLFGDERIYSSLFEINGQRNFIFNQLTSKMSENPNIISVQTTNLE